MQPNSTTSDNKASYASQSSIEGYVDSIVDDQYVVIEASPSNSGSSHSSQGVRGRGVGETWSDGIDLVVQCRCYYVAVDPDLMVTWSPTISHPLTTTS